MSEQRIPPLEAYTVSTGTETRVHYARVLRPDGALVELYGFHKANVDTISSSPNHSTLIDDLVERLRGTGVSKIEITLLDANLGGDSRDDH